MKLTQYTWLIKVKELICQDHMESTHNAKAIVWRIEFLLYITVVVRN